MIWKKRYESSGYFTFSERGQITIFIVVGMVILFSLAFIFWLTRSSALQVQEDIPITIQTAPLEAYVQRCIESTAEQAILENGRRGGFFILPLHSTFELFEDVPYYFDVGQDFFPADEVFAAEIGSYVDNLLSFCLNDFEPFQKHGYSITAGTPVSVVTISPRKIKVQTTLPLAISRGIQIRELSTFVVDVPTEQFYNNVQAAKEIVQSSRDAAVCLNCFSNITESNNLFVGILPYYNNTYIFDMADQDYLFGEEEYHLRFAVRYNETPE